MRSSSILGFIYFKINWSICVYIIASSSFKFQWIYLYDALFERVVLDLHFLLISWRLKIYNLSKKGCEIDGKEFFHQFFMLYFTSNYLKSPKHWSVCNIFQLCVKIKISSIIVCNFHKDITKTRFTANYWKLFVKITVWWLTISQSVYVMCDLLNETRWKNRYTLGHLNFCQ